MKKIQLFSLLVLLTLGMTACKYDEGPFISFVPKVERVANTWVVNTANINGVDGTTIPNFKQISLFKEGGVQIIYTLLTVEYAYTGTWALDDKKEIINMDVTDELTGLIHETMAWTILHLKEDILKVSYTSSGDLYIVEFKPKV